MIRSAAFLCILALRISYHPAPVAEIAPFASPAPIPVSNPVVTASLIDFKGSISHNKVLLNWSVIANETAYQFEVEKSTDGKHFSMAGIVFGTDQAETGHYVFYEKAGNHKVSYRIKLVNKNREGEYSPVIVLNPKV